MRLQKILPLAAAALLAITGCSKESTAENAKTFMMGSPAAAGQLTYTVLHSAWRDSLDTSAGAIHPKNRFLVLDILMSSGGGEEIAVPLLFVVNEKGEEVMEEQKMAGLQGWLGLLRVIRPVESLQGKVVFDVPMGNYKLKLSSGGDVEREVTAFVDLPLRLENQGGAVTDKVPGSTPE